VRNGERITLWLIVAVLAVGQIVAVVMLYGEIAAVRTQFEVAAGARPASSFSGNAALPTPAANISGAATWGTALTVRALGASQPLSETAVVTLTARGSGAADPLLELPVLDCDGVPHPVDGASLEQARQDLLALITRGEGTAVLVFYAAPDLTQVCQVVLNPGQPASSVVAPRIVVPVPQLTEEP